MASRMPRGRPLLRGRWPLCGALALAVLPLACGQPLDDDDTSGLVGWDAVPVGSFVFTEILANPNAGRPEFVEIVNSNGAEVNLQACELVDGGSTGHAFIINQPMPVAAGARVLLGSSDHLGASDGELPVDVQWSGITLNQGDTTELVALHCPDGLGARHEIDSVAFDWSGMGLRRGRSWQLATDPDASTNDDPANWCQAPAQDDALYGQVDGEPDYGSPGEPTVCETPGGVLPQSAGEVVISEILIDAFTGLREWFELHNPGSQAVDVRGCVIGEGPIGGGSDSEHTLDYELGNTVIVPGGYILLSKTATDVTSDGAIVADYPFSSLSFANSDTQAAWIDCPVGDQLTRIDQIVFDWGDYGSAFKGYSLSLSPASLSAEANDDAENWCLAGEADLYFTFTDEGPDAVTYQGRGTPGEANTDCPVPGPPPGEGDLVITEVLVEDFTGVSEWFELHNPGTEELDLVGCTMLEHAFGDSCEDDATNCRHEFTVTRGQTVVPAGAYLLIARTDAEVTDDGSVVADYWYNGSIIFTNIDAQQLSIHCTDDAGADVVVDSVTYSWDEVESAAGTDLKGRSWSLSASSTSATGNDIDSNWCPARDEDLYYSTAGSSGAGDDEALEARGTPRAANPACP